MVTLQRSFLFTPLVAVAVLGAFLAPSAGAKTVAKYRTCDTAKEILVPAKSGLAGCYVNKSAANVAFAQKAIDKRYTDILEPSGDDYGNIPTGKIDCRTFFDKKKGGSVLHCIRTFVWAHKHDATSFHKGTCKYGVAMTYVVGGTKRKGSRLYVRYVPNAAPYGWAWTHEVFKLYFGNPGVPTPECSSASQHQSGGVDSGPLVSPDDLELVPLIPPNLTDD